MSDDEDQRFGAARFGDEITHGMGMVGMVGGAVLGLIVGAVIVGASVATGGLADLAFVAIVGGSIAGGGLSGGSLIKGIMKHFNMPGPVSGTLSQGVPNIRINGRPVMRAGVDYAEECSGAPMTHFKRERVLIAEGSGTVRFNGYPAARLGSKLTCGATIKTGSSNVFIGGPTVNVLKNDMDDNEAAFEDILGKLGIVALVCGGAVALAAGGAGILVFGAIIGGTKFALNAAHKWGDSLGPGCGDIVEGVLGFAMLGLGAKGADSEAGEAAMEGRLKIDADPNKMGINGGNLKATIIPKEEVPTKGISQEEYDYLRKRTPTPAIRAMVNEGVTLPMEDPALPGLQITSNLHAEHIVSMKETTEMDGFDQLTTENQLKVLNNTDNYTGLSETANTSKGSKTYEDWTLYKKGNIPVDETFRQGMIERANTIRPQLQQQIYDLLKIQDPE